MVSRYDNQPFGNLRNTSVNKKAAEANVRSGRQGAVNLNMGRTAQGGSMVFDAMMAVNESQNQIIGQVLDGPVSQQTQRQLAQLKTMNMKNPTLEEISQSQIKPANSDGSLLAAGQRIFGNLQGGRTLRKGVDTGKIFSPSQLESYRKRNGLARVKAPVALTAEGTPGETIVQKAARTGTDTSDALIKNSAIKAVKDSIKSGDKKSQIKEGFWSDDKINSMINKVGEALGIDPSLIRAVVKTESNFNQKAVSRAGAKGLMQLMPKTAQEMGVSDPFNPFENIWGGARYLKKMLDRHGGNLNKALAAYNWGPGNLDRHGSSRMPTETRRYIEVVNRNYSRFKKESTMA
ncbi:MAG: lytic transglycosylase domain-containing protein [Deltaproteobacteria bacterium]|nr:lytic transglycosylase domain-containing protein [Deltaproteobacteria bacterium]